MILQRLRGVAVRNELGSREQKGDEWENDDERIERGKEIMRFGLSEISNFIDLVILPGYRGALRVQGCLSYMTYNPSIAKLPKSLYMKLLGLT